MKKKEYFIEATGGKELFAKTWEPQNGKPKAAVLIIHGIAEHSGRYEHFTEFLTGHQMAAIAFDHRGHGKTDPDRLGLVDSSDQFITMVSDIEYIRNDLQKQFPGTPLIFFAHSMGSFLCQRYLQLYEDKPDGVIYSGSSGKPPFYIHGGIILARLIRKIKGRQFKSSFIRNLTFGPYNAMFKPNRTDHDWLTRDENEVDVYCKDPRCGFLPSVSLLHDLFNGLDHLHRTKPFTGSDPAIPILIISGTDDPVGYMGEGTRRLEKQLIESGATRLTVKLYDDARHVLLNEINREEVMDDVVEWIEEILDKA